MKIRRSYEKTIENSELLRTYYDALVPYYRKMLRHRLKPEPEESRI